MLWTLFRVTSLCRSGLSPTRAYYSESNVGKPVIGINTGPASTSYIVASIKPRATSYYYGIAIILGILVAVIGIIGIWHPNAALSTRLYCRPNHSNHKNFFRLGSSQRGLFR